MSIQPRTRIAALATLLLSVMLPHGEARADEPSPQVKVTTNMGEFVTEVRQDRSPLTAANFLRYVREGFYSGTVIHRAVANFVIQGGGHDATSYALRATHENVFNESGNGLQNKRGTVGMARGDTPHSGNAQFYVNLVDNPDLDPVSTRWGYTVFGRIVQGMDVIDHVGQQPTGDNPGAAATAGHDPLAEVTAWRACSSRTCIWMPARPRPPSSSSGFSPARPRPPRRSTSSATCSRPGWAMTTRIPPRSACAGDCAHSRRAVSHASRCTATATSCSVRVSASAAAAAC